MRPDFRKHVPKYQRVLGFVIKICARDLICFGYIYFKHGCAVALLLSIVQEPGSSLALFCFGRHDFAQTFLQRVWKFAVERSAPPVSDRWEARGPGRSPGEKLPFFVVLVKIRRRRPRKTKARRRLRRLVNFHRAPRRTSWENRQTIFFWNSSIEPRKSQALAHLYGEGRGQVPAVLVFAVLRLKNICEGLKLFEYQKISGCIFEHFLMNFWNFLIYF